MLTGYERRFSERLVSVKVTRLVLFAALGAACLPAADEAATPARYNGSGYVTFGAGFCQHQVANLSISGGGSGFLWKGLALGGEIGYYRFVEQYSQGFGIGSVDIGYHFVNRARPGRFDPFINGSVAGVGVMRGGAGAAGGIGGGVNYWFKPHVGLRAEFRAQVFAEEAIGMFRIGLSFR